MARELRIIGEAGQSLGIVSREEALKMAKEANSDLVIVSDRSAPPVAKILDWGKYSYQTKKKQQKNALVSASKSAGVKQMRFSIKIGEYDLDVKLRKVSKFLEEGHKVKITVILKGREMEHKDLAFELAQKIVTKLQDVAVVEQEPKINNRQVNLLVRGSK